MIKYRLWGAWLLLCLLVIACKGSENTTESENAAAEQKESAMNITVQPLPNWELYYSDDYIMRFRKKDSEAIIDLIVYSLGTGNSYATFNDFSQSNCHVSLPSEIVEDIDVTIDGMKARRISFTGQRADTGESTAGIRYLLEHNSKAYFFVYLDAGTQIETNRKEAQSMIESIRFKK